MIELGVTPLAMISSRHLLQKEVVEGGRAGYNVEKKKSNRNEKKQGVDGWSLSFMAVCGGRVGLRKQTVQEVVLAGFELESMSILPLLLVLLFRLGTQLIADAAEDICSRLTPNDDGGDRGRRYLAEDVSNGSH